MADTHACAGRAGAFDLDPCAPAVRPWDAAARHYV